MASWRSPSLWRRHQCKCMSARRRPSLLRVTLQARHRRTSSRHCPNASVLPPTGITLHQGQSQEPAASVAPIISIVSHLAIASTASFLFLVSLRAILGVSAPVATKHQPPAPPTAASAVPNHMLMVPSAASNNHLLGNSNPMLAVTTASSTASLTAPEPLPSYGMSLSQLSVHTGLPIPQQAGRLSASPASPSQSTYSLSAASYRSESPGSTTSLRASPVVETSSLVKSIDDVSGVKTINQYVVLHEIGRGVHGKVKLARQTDTGELFSGRNPDGSISNNNGPQSPQLEKIRREIAIMKKCIHPNVVQLVEVIDDPNSDKVYMVLEHMAGGEIRWKRPLPASSNESLPWEPVGEPKSLVSLVNESNRPMPLLNEQECRLIFRDVVAGLEYLHTQGIIHRDVKPANLLRSNDGVVKLSDFGVSHFSQRQLKREQKEIAAKRRSSSINLHAITHVFSKRSRRSGSMSTGGHTNGSGECSASEDEQELGKTAGSPAFFAPELCVLGDDSHDEPQRPIVTKAIDVWALGVTLYCLYFGVCPFVAATEYELFEIIPSQPLAFPPDVPLSDDLRHLFEHLLDKDPDTRYTLAQAKRHPWTTADLSETDATIWFKMTDPVQYEPLKVTDAEVQAAFTHDEYPPRPSTAPMESSRDRMEDFNDDFTDTPDSDDAGTARLGVPISLRPRPVASMGSIRAARSVGSTSPHESGRWSGRSSPAYATGRHAGIDSPGTSINELNDTNDGDEPEDQQPSADGSMDMEAEERRRMQTWESEYSDDDTDAEPVLVLDPSPGPVLIVEESSPPDDDAPPLSISPRSSSSTSASSPSSPVSFTAGSRMTLFVEEEAIAEEPEDEAGGETACLESKSLNGGANATRRVFYRTSITSVNQS
ncbi:kinase-like domain-containing protein [Catenaria anguillulae PL171]|uniref:Kinase-like domain-containing protein n=1 Tax=Catenaria anguillulae PL171 TaxID=765915 RepID=A0A1Y2HXH2_9FUNG|nr:kinase-like domain-containing protein [Catenaria anguillulae PL171]